MVAAASCARDINNASDALLSGGLRELTPSDFTPLTLFVLPQSHAHMHANRHCNCRGQGAAELLQETAMDREGGYGEGRREMRLMVITYL